MNSIKDSLINTMGGRRTVDESQSPLEKLGQKTQEIQQPGSFFCISVSAVLESAEVSYFLNPK